MAFPYAISGFPGYEKDESSTQKHPLGTKMVFPDGRTFYYAKNSSAAITTGGMIVDGAGITSGHGENIPVTAATAAGSSTISLEVPTTDLTKNQYANGYLIINDGPGEGEIYEIESHPAHDTSEDATAVFTIRDRGGIATALTTSSLAGLFVNPYTDVKLLDGDGTMTTGPLGVTCAPVTASYYCWLQTSGIGSVAIGAQVAVVGDGLTISQQSGESGMAERTDYSDEADLANIGVAIAVVGDTTDKQPCMLTIRS